MAQIDDVAAPKTIVYVIDKLANAGAQNHLFELSSRLDRARYKPIVCCLSNWGDQYVSKYEQAGVEVVTLGSDKIYGASAWRALRSLIRLLRKQQAIVVHTLMLSSNVFGSIAGYFARTPLIITTRRDAGVSRKSWRLRVLEERIANMLSHKIVCVSQEIARSTTGEPWATPSKVSSIANGIDLSKWQISNAGDRSLLAEFGINDNHKVIGVVANLKRYKGHQDLLAALDIVRSAHPEVRLLLIGAGPDLEFLTSEVERLNLQEYVAFAGTRRDVRELMPLFDISVLPSHTEGMSNVVLESMALGLPVIATSVGGNLELINNGVNGVLISPKAPKQLAKAVSRLLSDTDYCQTLGAAARTTIEENFSVHRMVNCYESLYASMR